MDHCGVHGRYKFKLIHHRDFDTTAITSHITRLIATGTTEEAILAAVAYLFPEISPSDLSAALQEATEAAERRVFRKH
jgi:uncharacterized protein (DUF433 family)